MRRALLTAAIVCAFAAPAAASPVLVYDGGKITQANDPWLPAPSATNTGIGVPTPCNASAVPRPEGVGDLHTGDASASAISVGKALSRAYARHDIDRETYSGYKDVYSKAKSA